MPAPGDELPVNSPFFKPYEGNFFIDIATSYRTQDAKVTIPVLSSSLETATREAFTAMTLLYGVTENFTVGILSKYMWQYRERAAYSGIAFAGNPGSSSLNNGFYDLGFALGFRFLGTRSEEWFINLDVAFLPGLRDSNNFKFTWPQNQYAANMVVGTNTANWSYGLTFFAQFYDSSPLDKDNEKNNQITSSAYAFVQAELDGAFVRLGAGIFKFLDAASNRNAVRRNFFPAAVMEWGLLLSESAAISAKLTYFSGTRGDLEVGPFTANFVATPVWQGTLSFICSL